MLVLACIHTPIQLLSMSDLINLAHYNYTEMLNKVLTRIYDDPQPNSRWKLVVLTP